MTYLWFKTLHLVFMVSWFAGLFYLPRIFVNLAMADDAKTYNHLLTMAKKLYRFVTPFLFLTVLFGVGMLYFNSALLDSHWMQLKLLLVVFLIGYHFVCGHYLKKFTQRGSMHGHVFYRWFNEFPVLILFAVVYLVVIRPF